MKRKSKPSLFSVAKRWVSAPFKKRGLYDAWMSTSDYLGLPGGGGYQVLDPQRKMINGLQRQLASYSANELASLSLPQLRALCRKLERENATARAAVEAGVACFVGTGIALEPDTGDKTLDKLLAAEFKDWCAGCDVTGTRSIYDLQAEGFRSWFLAGEHLWRFVVLPELVDQGKIPLAILPLDSEWICHGIPEIKSETLTRVAGLELDKYARPIAYWLKNPEETGNDKAERVPAEQIAHGFEHRRPLQNRGEPWLAPVIERIHQEGDLIDTELKAAINCSGIAVVITSDYHQPLDDGTSDDQRTDGTATDPAQEIGIGSVARALPGEQVQAFSHNRPGQQIAPFTGLLRGSIAASCRISRRFLDSDYSQANFSSQRADEQDHQRLQAPVRESFGHSTIGAAYLKVLPYLCAKIGKAVPVRKAYRLLPDGQPYVNPVDDIRAVCLAVAAGLTTWEAEIAKRGGDRDAVWAQLAKEHQEAQRLGLNLNLSGNNSAPQPQAEPKDDAEQEDGAEDDTEDDTEDDEEMKRADFLEGLRTIMQANKPAPAPAHEVRVINETRMDEKTAEIMGRAIAENTRKIEIPATVVNVPAPVVNVAAPTIRNEIPAQPPALAPIVNVAAPNVTVAAPNVTVENQTIVPQRSIRASQQRDGSLLLEPQGE
jgi:lambda family phage portal protein